VSVSSGFAQAIRYITKEDLTEILNNPDDKLHVINFWASWCGPCVTELPVFQKMVSGSDSSKVDFLFVSLDFPSEVKKSLLPFLNNHGYTFNTALMTDIDYNSWIDIVHPDWQGNIPATLFFNNSRKIHQFISESMDKTELEQKINSLLIN
jgi:thiol-disulfide isomerase/thioredoxin